MRFQMYFLFVQCVILCDLNDVTNAKALVGQNVRQARDNEFPFLASLMRTIRENNQLVHKHYCTGSLISIRHVLTADHCMQNEERQSIKVMVGSINLNFGVKYDVMWWMSYSQWIHYKSLATRFINNDIAIIKLMADVLTVTPAILSSSMAYGFFGLNVVAVGWGRSESGEIPSILRAVNLTVLTNNNCAETVSRLQGRRFAVPPRYVCTTAQPYALLHTGDSGGPLLHNGIIIAISISTCPLPYQQIHPEKVNLHLVMEYYLEYVNDIRNNF